MAELRTKTTFRMKLHVTSSDRIKLTTTEVLGKLRAVYAEREKAGRGISILPAPGDENNGKQEETGDDTGAQPMPPKTLNTGKQEGGTPDGAEEPPFDDDEAWRLCAVLAWTLTDDKTLSTAEALARLRALPGSKRWQLARWLESQAKTVRAVWPEKKLTKNQSLQLVALGGNWLETVLADEGMLAYALERLQRLDLQALLELVAVE